MLEAPLNSAVSLWGYVDATKTVVKKKGKRHVDGSLLISSHLKLAK